MKNKKCLKYILRLMILGAILTIDPFSMFTEEAVALSNIVVVIDPGHGGPGTSDKQDLGAEYNNVVEKDLTLITAEAMKEELEQYGNVTVYMTRTTDQAVKLDERSAFAASVSANVLISLHYNASPEHNLYGAEIFTSAFGQHYATGTGLASCFLEQLESSGAAIKGSKTRIGNSGADYYGIIRHGVTNNVPSIIVEHGYIDNDTDWNRIGTVDVWRQLGARDATAVAKYYGLKKGIVQTDVAPTVTVNIPTTTMMPDLTEPESVSLQVGEYDGTSVEVTITALEQDSKLMYCTYSFDDGVTFLPLSLWGDEAEHTETITPPANFHGEVIARVYNNYELYADSEPVTLDAPEKHEEVADKMPSDTLTQSDNGINEEPVSGNTSLWEDELQKTLDAVNIEDTPSNQNSDGLDRTTVIILIAAVIMGAILTVFAIAYLHHKKRKKRH